MPSESPAPHRPMLEELNRETEALYKEVGQSLVRVQLPKPQWMNDYAMAAMNRDRLDPEVRKRLEQAGGHAIGNGMTLVVRPASTTTVPSARDEPASTQPVKVDGHGTIVFVPAQASDNQNQPRDAVLGGRLQMDVNTIVPFTPNNVGLLLDDAGHVLVPLYVERETVGDKPVRISMRDGKVVAAKFVGSDRQTNLTLLQIDKPTGKAVQLAGKKPVDGSLVLFISTTDGSGRLGLWNGGQQDVGIIFSTDGGVAGIARYGQFLSGTSCHLIAEQLIQYGAVRRATLGVIVSEIRKDDPLREQLPVLGSRTAMRIDEVIAHSTADKAGLKPGDLLLALAGEGVSDIPSLAALIASRSGPTELQVLRGNEVLKLSVDLQQQK
ncbi:MAG TPA: PDZ domain-containing protein [Tepidisphaeraceae bacterium]|nr:PDZ domain-containing protein [Tepidisphaeraceae bacterium]